MIIWPGTSRGPGLVRYHYCWWPVAWHADCCMYWIWNKLRKYQWSDSVTAHTYGCAIYLKNQSTCKRYTIAHTWASLVPAQCVSFATLQWRHNGCDGVSNPQPRHCFLNCLLRHRSKKTSKLQVTGLCARNSPVNGEFPTQMASNSENVSMWCRHHEIKLI